MYTVKASEGKRTKDANVLKITKGKEMLHSIKVSLSVCALMSKKNICVSESVCACTCVFDCEIYISSLYVSCSKLELALVSTIGGDVVG